VKEAIDELFSVRQETRMCEECDEETIGHLEPNLSSVPGVLMINIKRFDDNKQELGKKQQAPLEIDMSEHYKGEGPLVLELFAVVSCSGKKLMLSQYKAAVLKGKQWVEHK